MKTNKISAALLSPLRAAATLLFLLVSVWTLSAQGFNSIVIHEVNGDSFRVEMKQGQKIDFSDDNLNITDGSNVVSRPLVKIAGWEFDFQLKLRRSRGGVPSASFDFGKSEISVCGLSGEKLCVYSLDGRPVVCETLQESHVTDISRLPAGIYIVKIGEESFKIKTSGQ